MGMNWNTWSLGVQEYVCTLEVVVGEVDWLARWVVPQTLQTSKCRTKACREKVASYKSAQGLATVEILYTEW